MTELKGKQVLVVGLGRFPEGSGMASVRYLVKLGAHVTVTDKKTREELVDQIALLGSAAEKIVWKLGRHDKEDFLSADVIVQNPAVPDHIPELKALRKKGIPIHNDITLFFEAYDGPILGVTGTRGKSTTSAWLWEMIKRKDARARLGGNIGTSPLAFLDELEAGTPVVLELSSWLLARLRTIKRSPHIAVVTNFFPDHLNAYKGDLDAYREDKEQIVAFQKEDDVVVLNADDAIVKRFARKTLARVDWFSDHTSITPGGVKRGSMLTLTEGEGDIELVRTAELRVPGAHNVRNALAASVAAWRFGVDPGAIREVLLTFTGLPYRLQEIAHKDGVWYINDSTSTMPDALAAALEAMADRLDRKRAIILIAGGNSKGLSYKGVHPLIRKYVKHLLLVVGDANDQFPAGVAVPDLQTALAQARAVAKPGDVILFSPGTTWLPKLDEFARGALFTKLVNAL